MANPMLLFFALLLLSCERSAPHIQTHIKPTRPSPRFEQAKYVRQTKTPELISLDEIDLSKIGHIAPKGRVQDKDYNQCESIVENRQARGL